MNTDNAKENRTIELDLMAKIVARDAAAFEELYASFYKRLYRFAFRVLGRDDGVQEVINDTMYVVWDKAATFDGSSKVSTWLFGIALHKAKNYYTKHGVPWDLQDTVYRVEDTLAADWEGSIETKDWLEVAMTTLSPEQRTVVELTYYQGLHYHEIAEIMDCPENTVKSRMRQGREKLKQALKRFSSGPGSSNTASGG